MQLEEERGAYLLSMTKGTTPADVTVLPSNERGRR